jgi:uncharacterized protein YndB with AHSA1/START domain
MATVRQQITIEASSRAVWNAITTEEGVRRWWSDEVRLDPREGGRVVIALPEVEGERPSARGIFLQVTPTRAVEITWDGGAWKGGRLQFQVGRGEGETKLHVVHTTPDDPERDPIEDAKLDRFWKDALKRLREALEPAA